MQIYRYIKLYEASPVPVLQVMDSEEQDLLKAYMKSLLIRTASKKQTPDGAYEELKSNLKNSHLDDTEKRRADAVLAYTLRLIKDTMRAKNIKKDDKEAIEAIVNDMFKNANWLKILEDGWLKRASRDGVEDEATPIFDSLKESEASIIKQAIEKAIEASKGSPDKVVEQYKALPNNLRIDKVDAKKRAATVFLYVVAEELKLDGNTGLKDAEKAWIDSGAESDEKLLKSIQSGVSKDVQTNRRFLAGEPILTVDLEDKNKIKPEVKDQLIDLLNSEFPESNAEMLKKDDVIAAMGIPIYRFIDEDGKKFDISLYPAKGKGINALGMGKLSQKLNLTKNFMTMIKTNKYATALSDNIPNWLNNGVVGRNAGDSKLHKVIAYATSKPPVILGKIAKLIGSNTPTAEQIIKRVKLKNTSDPAGF